MNQAPHPPPCYVRVTAREADWVQFEFSIGDPDLCVELTMRPFQYDHFRHQHGATELPEASAAQLDHERRHWRDSVPR